MPPRSTSIEQLLADGSTVGATFAAAAAAFHQQHGANTHSGGDSAAVLDTSMNRPLEQLLGYYRVSDGPRSFAFFQLRAFVQHFLYPRRELIARGVARALAPPSTQQQQGEAAAADVLPPCISASSLFAATHGTAAGGPDRRSVPLFTGLVNRVAQWSRHSSSKWSSTRELRAHPALLHDIVAVLECLVYMLFDEGHNETAASSYGPALAAVQLALDPGIKAAAAPAVSTLVTFAARACLFGYAPKAAAPVPSVYQREMQQHFALRRGMDLLQQRGAAAAATALASPTGKSDDGGPPLPPPPPPPQEGAGGDASASVAQQQQQQQKLEIDCRTAAVFLIGALVQMHPDAVFPLWSTLFPLDAATAVTDPAARSTLLSPLLFDDLRVRAAASFTAVAVVTSVPQTLAVVPLEVRATSALQHQTRRATSPPGTAGAGGGAVAASAGAYQSDISRVAFVVRAVYEAVIAGLRVHHTRTEEARQVVLAHIRDAAKPPDAVAITAAVAAVADASLAHHFSAALRVSFLNALASLSIVVPYQRAPSVAKLFFGYLQEQPRVLIAPIEAHREMARMQGGAIHHHDLSAALFLVATICNSAGARDIVRVFFAESAEGRMVLAACMSVLPHIDAWKVCSALARQHPDALRSSICWPHAFAVAKELFRITSKALESSANRRHQNQQQQRQAYHHIPYQAALECLRAFVYFIGAKTMPWERGVGGGLTLAQHGSGGGTRASRGAAAASGGGSSSSVLCVVKKASVPRRMKSDGLTANVVALDSSDEREMSDHRASHQEIADILRSIALPATRSLIDNVRCVAFRVLGAIPESFFAARPEASSTPVPTTPSAAVASPSLPSAALTEKEKDALCDFLLDRCRSEVDEARLEILGVAYCWISDVPTLAARVHLRLGALVCDELLGRADLLATDGRTRACQVMEALARGLRTIPPAPTDENDDDEAREEAIGAACSRILHAAWRVLQFHQERGSKAKGKTGGAAAASTSSSAPATADTSTPLQIASCVRSCAAAVCALPEQYLFMGFGPRGDDVVSWLFALLCERSEAIIAAQQQRCASTNNNNNNTNDDGEATTSTTAVAVPALRLPDAFVLIALLESLGKLCAAAQVAECDPEGASRAVHGCLAQAVALFTAVPRLSREMYAVAGAALRALTKIARDEAAASVLFASAAAAADDDELPALVENTLKALRRSSRDADVARSGLQEDFNRAGAAALGAIVGRMRSMPADVQQQVASDYADLMEEFPAVARLFCSGAN